LNPRRDAAAYAASRKMERRTAIVDGARLQYVVAGDGPPVIVFLNGARMPLDSWFRILPEAARLGTTFAYDRPGTGGSDAPSGEQSGTTIVDTLRATLETAGLGPPFVLVGHSLGGLYANLFARTHPDEIAGVVLVDSASRGDVLQAPPAGSVARAINAVVAILDRVRGQPGHGEIHSVDATLAQIEDAPAFPPIPLVVITGGRRMPLVPASAFQAHVDNQRELVGLSPLGRQVIGRASGHFPQLDEPALVIQAIRDVVERVRS
jgi:pimeloyl-ACP methyl ester carboxylesterase